ncbi:MAG: hypothetical protein ACK40S_13890 [Burkholderiaceae bacterium]
MKTLALALSSAVLLAACAASPSVPVQAKDGVLVGPNGMTLYTFDRDTAGNGKSVCNGPCATNWPPLLVKESRASGDYAVSSSAVVGEPYSVVIRDDGSRQLAYKGKPLYYWAKDAKPGDRTGDGFNNVWRLARP